MADPVLEPLLEVQAHDLVVARLRYRRQRLPERALLTAEQAAQADLERASDERAHGMRLLDRERRRLEEEIDSIEARAGNSERRLYSGDVHAPKELQALAHEVEALQRRKRELEDELLDVMERTEPLIAETVALEERRRQVEAEMVRLRGVVADQEVEIDGRLAEESAARSAAAERVPPDLLATYERLRDQLGGIGVARLYAGRCTGCHLGLPAVELDALRRAPEGAVVRHEECGRILVP